MSTRSLGTLTIDLVAKIGGFQQGMDQAARISDKRMREIQRAATATGKVIGASLLAGGTALAYGVIRNTIEAEKQFAQLEAALKSTHHIAGLTSGELAKMADRFQSLTAFEDDAIIGSQALLLTFTKIGREVFPEAIQSILDLSTALGKDLQSSTTLVGKALNDPIAGLTALSKAGVQFSDDQKKVIKEMVETNHIADAQRLVLKELETQFGGSAEAARNTLGGAFEALQNAAGNLLEGDSGSEGIVGLKKEINALTDTLNDPDVQRGFQDMIGWMAKLAQFSAEAITAVTGLYRAFSDSKAPNDQKSYDGLLQRRLELQNKIAAGGRLPASEDPLANALGITNSDAVAKAKKELAQIDALIKKHRFDQIAAGIQFIDPPPAGWVANRKTETATGGGSSGTSAAEKAARELEQAMKDQADAAAAFRQQTEDLAASLGGPLAQAELEAIRREDQLVDLARRGQIGQDELATALGYVEAERQKTIASIQSQLTPQQKVLAGLQEELKLLGMTAEQQAVYNTLKEAGVTAESAFGKQITETMAQIRAAKAEQAEQDEALREQIGRLDEFRSAFSDNVADVLTGTQSIGDAVDNMAKRITQILSNKLADQFTDWLLGAQGTSNTGWLGSLFGSLSSSGGSGGVSSFSSSSIYKSGTVSKFASGTDFAPGGLALVGEEGPELVNLPRGARVMPADQTARMLGGPQIVQHINVLPGASRETGEQSARAAGREARTALARTG